MEHLEQENRDLKEEIARLTAMMESVLAAQSQTSQTPAKILTMSTTLKIDGHTDEAKKLRMFSFTLAEDTEEWLYSLPAGSITSWKEMETAFLNEYFPASIFLRKRYEIVNF